MSAAEASIRNAAKRLLSLDEEASLLNLTTTKMATEAVVIIINIARKTPINSIACLGKSIIKSPSQHHLRGALISDFSLFYKDFFFLFISISL